MIRPNRTDRPNPLGCHYAPPLKPARERAGGGAGRAETWPAGGPSAAGGQAGGACGQSRRAGSGQDVRAEQADAAGERGDC